MEPGHGPCLIAFLLVAHYDLLLGNGCLSGRGPCLVAFSFRFGLVGLHFLAFWPFGPSFPFILAFWAFISFHFGLLGFHFLHFGLLGLHFLSFWPFGPSFPFILASCILALRWLACGPPPTSCQKRSVFPMPHIKNLAAPGPAPFSTFWPFGPSFPFILAFCAFISFQFGLLGLHFLSFWPVGPSSCILALW